jgi:hypothetical protein
MSTSEDHILREQRPVYSLVPNLDVSLELSKTQIEFLLHAIRDVNPEAVDAGARIKQRVFEVQRKCVVQFLHYDSPWVSLTLDGFSEHSAL